MPPGIGIAFVASMHRRLLYALAAFLVMAACAISTADLKGSGRDPADLDRSAGACNDFYRFANGGWLDTHPVPPAFPAWGQANVLGEQNRRHLHEILDDLVAHRESFAAGTDEQKLATLYGSCMDESARERAGVTPLQPALDRVAALATPSALAALLGHLAVEGIEAPFGITSEPDPNG